MIKTCLVCGSEFKALRFQKTCSEKCAKERKQIKNREYRVFFKKTNPNYFKDYVKKNIEKIRIYQNKYKKQPKYKEWIRNYEREKDRKLKLKLIEQLGSKCQNCGLKAVEQNSAVFDFHHLNPNEKESRRERFKKDFDLSKVILLCSNCHRLEHFKI